MYIFFGMCIVCYAIVIDVTARLFFFQSKRGVYRLGGMRLGVIYDFKNYVLGSYICAFSIFAVVPISSSLV